MAKNKLTDLRDHLFETIELLKDEDNNSMTVEKAKAIAAVAQTIINTAKLEIDFVKAVDGSDRKLPVNKFIENSENTKQLT
jgi:hypothetical protein